MRIVVTGGIGFIGTHVCTLLKERGHDVIAYDNNKSGAPDWLKDLRRKYSAVNHVDGDILDLEKFTETLKSFSANLVINLAAKPGVRDAETSPDEYIRVNVVGFETVLNACKIAGVPKVVHSSSSSVYGQSIGKIRESDKLVPLGKYGETKMLAEQKAIHATRDFGLDVRILRPFTVFGPMGRPDMAPWDFTHRINNKQSIELHANAFRDFTSVHDVSLAFVLASEINWNGCEIYNIGSGESHGADELARAIGEFIGLPLVSDIVELPKFMPKRTCADITKAKEILGWYPKVSFRDAVKEFTAWFDQYAKNQK